MNRSKATGTQFETDVVGYLAEHGHPHVERRALRGADDRGDIAGLPGFVIEVKACKELTLGPWLNEVETERRNAGARFGAVVAKRRGKSTGDAFVILTLAQFAALLADEPAP